MNSKTLLIMVFFGVLSAMAWATIRASVDRGVFEAATDLARDPWFVATLFDAYFGFLTFYLWVFYKESKILSRLMWFVLIMSLGNFAIAFYVLRELFRLPADAPVSTILLRRTA